MDKHFFGGKATAKQITISLGKTPAASKIQLLLVIPNARPSAAPVFLGLNFCGNHTLVTDTNVALPVTWMPKGSPGSVDNRRDRCRPRHPDGRWAIEQSIDRGYAVATFYYGDVEPDRPDADGGHPGATQTHERDGRHRRLGLGPLPRGGLSGDRQGHQPAPHRRGGHSRNGKAAALAAAFDDRIALAIPLQAGCGGTSPSRGKTGESVKAINEGFPYWFNGEFKKFNAAPERLPFDQNCLVALIAPRPVMFSCATEDTWSNPAGQFEILQAADPVYRFLDAGGLDARQMPETSALSISRLTYYIRPGKHSMTKDDWKVFLDFADQQMTGATPFTP